MKRSHEAPKAGIQNEMIRSVVCAMLGVLSGCAQVPSAGQKTESTARAGASVAHQSVTDGSASEAPPDRPVYKGRTFSPDIAFELYETTHLLSILEPLSEGKAAEAAVADKAWTERLYRPICAPNAKCEQPFRSTSPLPPHEGKRWVLTVGASAGLGALLRGGHPLGFNVAGQEKEVTFQVAENRAGDVPLPTDFSWRCRFNHAVVMDDPSIRFNVAPDAPTLGVVRQIECSDDGWKTSTSSTAGYPIGFSSLQHRRASLTVRDLRATVTIDFASVDASSEPELP
jgi:hypothetical protein